MSILKDSFVSSGYPINSGEGRSLLNGETLSLSQPAKVQKIAEQLGEVSRTFPSAKTEEMLQVWNLMYNQEGLDVHNQKILNNFLLNNPKSLEKKLQEGQDWTNKIIPPSEQRPIHGSLKDIAAKVAPVKKVCPKPNPCTYLSPGTHTFDPPLNHYDNIRAHPKFPDASIKEKFNFTKTDASGTVVFVEEDAIRYPIDVQGKIINIYTPYSADPNTQKQYLSDAKRLAKSLGVMNGPLTSSVDSVVISDVAYPWNPASKAVASGVNGKITFYPSGLSGHKQAYLDSTMLHESGHNLMDRIKKDINPSFGDEWKAAAASDGRNISNYAGSNEQEDFAESVNGYRVSKNTPCEKEFKKLYPARYAMLEKVFYNPAALNPETP